jgi:hypothetical protein
VALHVINYLDAAACASLERLVRSTLTPLDRNLEVSITAALEPSHAEIVIKEDGVWRGGCVVSLHLAPELLSAKILDSLRIDATDRGVRDPEEPAATPA